MLQRYRVMEKIMDIINEEMERWHIPGVAVAVVDREHIIREYTAGVGNVYKQNKVTRETRFAMASGTKPMTSALIAILIDEGILNYDVPVRDYMPAFEMYDDAASKHLTLRDILCHRSGLCGHDAMWPSVLKREDFIRRLRYLQPNMPFRYCSQYSNVMFTAAGYIAQYVTGIPWETLMQEKILLPLGMIHSGFSAIEMKKQRDFADGYLWCSHGLEIMPSWEMQGAEPAASLYSNLEDMEKWLQMQLGHGIFQKSHIISEENMEQMHKPHMVLRCSPWVFREFPDSGAFALGWMRRIYRGYVMLYHHGEIEGYCSLQVLLPELDKGAVIMVNRHGSCHGFLYTVLFNIIDRILGICSNEGQEWGDRLWKVWKQTGMDKQVVQTNEYLFNEPEDPEFYTGDYEHKAYGLIKITAENSKIFMTFGQQKKQMFYVNKYQFIIKGFKEDTLFMHMRLQFYANENGCEAKSFDIPLEPSVAQIHFVRIN